LGHKICEVGSIRAAPSPTGEKGVEMEQKWYDEIAPYVGVLEQEGYGNATSR